MEKLWRRLRDFSTPDRIISTPLRWRADMKEHAAFLERNGVKRAIIAGYSWGAGVGAIALAKRLMELGVDVRLMCLCDPVWRGKFLPSWIPFNPLAMTGIPKIKIPKGVKRVVWARQENNRPKGHELIGDTVETPLVIPTLHQFIDDHPDWLKHALEAIAYEIFNGRSN
jgi:pimeloyl-ACP methyl ester carboxylesterase